MQGALPAQEEDANGNGKRVGRSRLSPTLSTANLNEIKPLVESPSPPKHIPFPYIPHDGELLFEGMNFVFALVATGLQFLNLYRTAWWLPHSYTNQAMVRYFCLCFKKNIILISINICPTLIWNSTARLLRHALGRFFNILSIILINLIVFSWPWECPEQTNNCQFRPRFVWCVYITFVFNNYIWCCIYLHICK